MLILVQLYAAQGLVVPHWLNALASAGMVPTAGRYRRAHGDVAAERRGTPGRAWLPSSARTALSGAMLTFVRVAGHQAGRTAAE